ncbi:MAG: glycosyltransferase 87 family protein [Streptosporangiaceae bacterium]
MLSMTIHLGATTRSARPVAGTAALAAVNLGVLAYFLLRFSRHGISLGPYRIDLDVYRIGSRVWLDGGNLYGPLPPTAAGVGLPFTYPPIAAVLLAPLTLLPMKSASTLLTLLSAALTAVVLRLFVAASWPPAGNSERPAGWRTVGWLLPAALMLEPVRSTILYGQVNVLLMALVTADCLGPVGRWPRGALVGLAAAVKLTPAAFLLFFLLRRDWRAAATAALSFCLATAAGFALAWRDSLQYWTSTVFQIGRPGNPIYAANQSIEAVLARAGLVPDSLTGRGVWLAASALVVLLACLGMRHALDRGQNGSDHGNRSGEYRGWDAWALSLNAFAALLVSPISWSHHWVWGETAMLVLTCLSLREPHPALRRCGLAFAAAGTALFVIAPQWRFPSADNRELHWAWWEQLVGSSYVIVALTVLLATAVACVACRRTTAAGKSAPVQLARNRHGHDELAPNAP